MKKRSMVLLLLCMIFILSGCGSNNSDKTPITSVDDLSGKSIGVQLGTTGDIYASDYEGDDEGTVIERYNKGTDAVQALLQGKVDCVILDEQPAKAYIANNNSLSILEEDFANEDYAMCIAKENSELKEQINEALSELKEEGTLELIIGNYIGDDTKGTYTYETVDEEKVNGTLVVATNAAFEPYEYYENGQVTGIDIDMARAIADKLSMEIEIVDMEFDSIINAVSSGKADIGVAGMTVTQERLLNIDFTDSYTNAKQVIIVKTSEEDSISIAKIKTSFYNNFVKDNRWQYLVKGLINTLVIALFAVALGVAIGFVVAMVRSCHDKTNRLKKLNFICNVYLTVIRGTPVMIQMLIIYYVIFSSININKLIVAIIAFGLNSGAYVAEIVRSGIMSVDDGQLEAGRSLGFTYAKTMRYIIIPQAIKNVLPALANEFIVLLKETSICGYIGLMDLTRGGDIIRSITYEPFLPLISVAVIYLIIVMVFTSLVKRLERRLRSNER